MARGIETWAADTARALGEIGGRGARDEGRDNGHGEPLEITLFAGAPLEGGVRKAKGGPDFAKATPGKRGAGQRKGAEDRGATGEGRGTRDEGRGAGGGEVAFGLDGTVGAGGDRASGRDPALTPHGYRNDDPPPSTVVLSCLRRGTRTARFLARWSPGFAWRWGLKNPYGWEQLSFWLKLWPRLVWGRFDILHVQDPMVADWCRRFRRLGLVKTKEILAHGTEEPIEFLERFEYVQHLAPWHLEEAERGGGRGARGEGRGAGGEGRGFRRAGRRWVAIPNFVNCEAFRPATSEEKSVSRLRLGIPADALVIGCVAAVKKDHKRIDYLVREVATLDPRPSYLLIAGARTDETGDVMRLAEHALPGRNRILLDCTREQMPDVYRAMDVFVLPSLFEMMPIALLEAMASELPCLVNRHPVLEWMIGEERGARGEARLAPASTEEGDPVAAGADRCMSAGGMAIDMSHEGMLSGTLARLPFECLRTYGDAARERAVRVFSVEAVIGEYVDYYRQVMGDT